MDKKKKQANREMRQAYGRISDREWKDHYELFRHLIEAGPTMHGTPGERKRKTH